MTPPSVVTSMIAHDLVVQNMGATDRERVDEMRFRYRLLYGEHERDVVEALVCALGPERAAGQKFVDVAANSYVQIHTQTSALYTYTPRVRGPSVETVQAVARTGHWERMNRVQRDVSGLREAFILVSGGDNGKPLQTRVVLPHWFEAPRSRVDDCSQIASIAVWLMHGDTPHRHYYQVEDCDGLPAPLYRETDAQGVTVSDLSGSAYPWRDNVGDPIIPGAMYHAAETGHLLDWRTGRDIARGAVRLMVFYTGAGHVILDASWAQRYAFNVDIDGQGVNADGSRQVIMDPAVIMTGNTPPDTAGQPLVGAFPQPADPEAVFRMLAMYSRQLGASAGIRSPEATRTESDIRSGYSLAVSREAVQELQATYAPVYRRADQQLLHVAACLLGEQSAGPEVWSIEYQALALDPSAFAAVLATVDRAITLDLMTPVQGQLMLYPWITVEEAEARVAELAAIKAARIATTALAPPAHTPKSADTEPPA